MRDPNKLSHSEAGKLGYLASIKIIEAQKEERRRVYYDAPILCQLCNKVIPYEKKVYINKSSSDMSKLRSFYTVLRF
jgi:hypothetical protein